MKDPAQLAHVEALYTLLPEVIASSGWVAQEIQKLGVKPFACVLPGVDRSLFYPRDRTQGDERFTVCIPMTPTFWWRGWDRGLELIQELERQAGTIDLRILVYGVDSLPIQSRAVCLGVLPQTRLAHVLGTEVDVLVDPSYVHSYGMPAVEAGASGVPVLCWDNRGVLEAFYGVFESFDGLVLDGTAAEMADAILRRAHENPLPQDFPDRADCVAAWIEQVEQHFRLRRKLCRICVVIPHARKWGGPTTMLEIADQLGKIGHEVSVVSVYDDVHPSIAARYPTHIRCAPKRLPDADVYLTNSDNPWTARVASMPGKGILLKLSHNPRFKALETGGLQQRWAAVVTTTEWLADACRKPWEGWEHPATEARAIGWWHYEHERFCCPPEERSYGDGTPERPITIATLIHSHASKGTIDALNVLVQAQQACPDVSIRFVGVGEVDPRAVPADGIEYVQSPSRDELAQIMRAVDIWVSCSKSEGLGRMHLEAMSAGAAVLCTDTGGDHLEAAVVSDLEPMPRVLASLLRDPKSIADAARSGFALAEQRANPQPCMDALQEVIEHVFS